MPASSPSPCRYSFPGTMERKSVEAWLTALTAQEELLLGLCPASSKIPVTRCQSVQRMV